MKKFTNQRKSLKQLIVKRVPRTKQRHPSQRAT